MLIFSRAFLPFFLSQALGAFNDNFYRNALVLLMTFVFVEQLGNATASLVALSSALFVLPYFLFSATAGRMADHLDKARLVQWLKWTELGVMLMAAAGFYFMNLWLLLAMLFLLGTQAAFFGPVKYAILPALLPKEKLLAGNAWIEASTFVVILAGTLLSSSLMLTEHGRLVVSLGCIGFAVAGVVASHFIAPLPSRSTSTKLRFNILADTLATLWFGLKQNNLRPLMLGIGWFWAVGTVFVSQLPMFAKVVLHDDGSQVMGLLAAFTIGIAAGAYLCVRLQRGAISSRTVGMGAKGMSIAALLFILSLYAPLPEDARYPVIIAILFSLAACGGLFVVPLYTLLQHQAEDRTRGRLVASSNIANALAMTAASVGSAILLAAQLPVAWLLAGWGAATLCVYYLVLRRLSF